MRALCLSLSLLVLPLPSAFANAALDPEGNAALRKCSRQAFCDAAEVFGGGKNKTIGDCLTVPLDDSVRKILTEAEYSLQMLWSRCAALKRCDWGMSYEDGIFALLPHAPGFQGTDVAGLFAKRLRL